MSAARRPFVIGVTGNIACGKSTVVSMLCELGAASVDADAVYHDLIRPGQPLWQALRDAFGESIVSADRQIDRRALGAIVFSNPEQLAMLDALTHPAVVAEVRRRIAAATKPVVVVDAVKLVESGMASDCDRLWLVTCDPDVQLQRLMTRNNLSEADARARIAAQPDLEAKRRLADLIIDNSGSVEDTRRQVEAGWRSLPILPI